jgi:hypothetical protein
MILRLDVFSGLLKPKSRPTVTASAWREDCAGYRCRFARDLRCLAIINVHPSRVPSRDAAVFIYGHQGDVVLARFHGDRCRLPG